MLPHLPSSPSTETTRRSYEESSDAPHKALPLSDAETFAAIGSPTLSKAQPAQAISTPLKTDSIKPQTHQASVSTSGSHPVSGSAFSHHPSEDSRHSTVASPTAHPQSSQAPQNPAASLVHDDFDLQHPTVLKSRFAIPQYQNMSFWEKMKWSARSQSLSLYEHNYFFAIRMSRKYLSHGRYLATLTLGTAIMAADPLRMPLRFLFAFLIGIFISAWIINKVRNPKKLSFVRTLPTRVTEGQPFEYEVAVTNSDKRPTPFLEVRDIGKARFPSLRDWYQQKPPFHDQINPFDRFMGYPKWLWLVEKSQDILGGDFVIPPLAPGETAVIKVKGIAFSRGQRLFLGFSTGLQDPFGLVRRLSFFSARQKLLVTPQPIATTLPLPTGSRSERRGETRDLHRYGDSDEFRSLREWRRGDPLKRMDWKATARTGTPITREYTPESFRRSAIALDTFLPASLDKQCFELTLKHCAGLLQQHTLASSEVDAFVTMDEVITLQSGSASSVANTQKALDYLAACFMQTQDHLPQLEQQLLAHAKSFSGLILVCSIWDDHRFQMAQRLTAVGLSLSILVCSDVVLAPAPVSGSFVSLSQMGQIGSMGSGARL